MLLEEVNLVKDSQAAADGSLDQLRVEYGYKYPGKLQTHHGYLAQSENMSLLQYPIVVVSILAAWQDPLLIQELDHQDLTHWATCGP